jgi:hypothetical protein
MVDRDNRESNRSDREEDFNAIRQEVEAEIRNDLGSEQLEPDAEDLESLETELGLQEVYLEEAAIDSIPADEADNYLDTDGDGIEDDDNEGEIVDDRPQELTESYGTGLQGRPLDRAGSFSRREPHMQNEPDYTLTGGDVDANYEDADAVGDEAVGGTVMTPDQDVVDELAAAVGVELDDRSFLRVGEMLEQRDDQRWELEPGSSEDYEERRQEE